MNMLFDVISQAFANVLMFLMGDARLEASTLMTGVCGISVFVGFMVVMWLIRPRPSAPPPPAPGTTVIVQQSTPVLLMTLVMVMMFGLGLLIVFVR